MRIAEHIKQLHQSLTPRERQVADYFLANQYKFSVCTLDQAAQDTNTSTTSVLHFCRRLGFVGYKDFQKQLQDEIQAHINLPDRVRQLSSSFQSKDLLDHIVRHNVENIMQTFHDLPMETLSKAVELVGTAKRVFTFGMRESYALAHYAYTRILATRSDVYILDAGQNGILESALNLTKDDICLVFLFHRYTDQALGVLSVLHRQGVPTILITSEPYQEVAPAATVLLPCLVSIHGLKNSSAAPVCLIDYLCNALAAANHDAVLARAELVEALLQSNDTLS